LLQTVLVVGWRMFAKEIWFTLTNRAIGIPTHEELREFYERLGLVLFGGHVFSAERFKQTLWLAFWFPGRLVVAVVLSVILLVSLMRQRRVGGSGECVEWATNVGKIGLWIGIPIVTPLIMFPAYAPDYGLYGTNEFLVAIFVVFAMATAFRLVRSIGYPLWMKHLSTGLLVIAALWIVNLQARSFAVLAAGNADWMVQSPEQEGFGWVAEHLKGQVVMTNVDRIVVGFFTRESAYGGCHRGSLPPDRIEPDRCFVRSFKLNPSAGLPVPSAFVWYGFGQAFCRAQECITREEIARRYPTLFESKRLAVFDLARRN